MPSMFRKPKLKKAVQSARPTIYVTSEDFIAEEGSVYEVVETKAALVNDGNGGEVFRAIATLRAETHPNAKVIGVDASYLRDPENSFHNEELVSFCCALGQRNPATISDDEVIGLMDKFFPIDDEEQPLPPVSGEGKKIGCTMKGKRKNNRVYCNPEWYAVDEKGESISYLDLD